MAKGLLWTLGLFLLYFCYHFLASFTQKYHRKSIEGQFQYIQQAMHNGLAEVEQTKFPEGYMFSQIISSLAIFESSCPFGQKEDLVDYLDQVYQQIISDKAISSFQSVELPRHGAFYNGWTNYFCKKYIESSLFSESDYQLQVQNSHDSLSNILENAFISRSGLLPSYGNSIWPADNLVGIVSLKDTSSVRREWFQALKENGSQGILLHDLHQKEVRGSSLALMTYLLSSFDMEESNYQFRYLQEQFERKRLGFTITKEFKEIQAGDVDSGPILFNFGSVASIVNMKVHQVIPTKSARASYALFHAMAFPIFWKGEMFYLFKQEPMFDIFMFWIATGYACP